MLIFPLCFQRPGFCSDTVYGMSRLRLGGDRRDSPGRCWPYTRICQRFVAYALCDWQAQVSQLQILQICKSQYGRAGRWVRAGRHLIGPPEPGDEWEISPGKKRKQNDKWARPSARAPRGGPFCKTASGTTSRVLPCQPRPVRLVKFHQNLSSAESSTVVRKPARHASVLEHAASFSRAAEAQAGDHRGSQDSEQGGPAGVP